MDTKLMLMPEPKSGIPVVTENGKLNKELQFDRGFSFPWIGWAITPTIVVEATSNIKHVYGKKVIYMYKPPYWGSVYPMKVVDIYDRQNQLWKCYLSLRGPEATDGIEYGNNDVGPYMYDLQAGHTSASFTLTKINYGTGLGELSLTKLLQWGR